ncbi:MAG: M20/M25/M40 family metallo-hydrolase [Acidobacteriia bacterium]|nr:M20/M25/M40 family metallo-hydrolase [Terriglobia bacterium]
MNSRKFRRLGLGVVLLFAVVGTAVSLPEAPSRDAAVDALIAQALGPSPLSETLRVLCDGIGGRIPGTPALEKAVNWGVENFRRAGVDNVHTEKYSIPHSWREGETLLEVVSPARFKVHATSVAWAPATPKGGITAEVVDVGDGEGEDFAKLQGQGEGKILLVHSRLMTSLDDLFAEYMHFAAVMGSAAQAKAAAVLFMSTRPRGLLYRHTNSTSGQIASVPMAIVGREDALRIARLISSGPQVQMHLSLPNEIGGPFETENVVADIKGVGKPDEMVILGAHLDSWELGTGALDNGCNASMVIDVARAFHAAGIRPQRTLRFILFTGEEEGLLGSRAYVHDHRSEMDRVVAELVFDEGVGRVNGFFLGGRKDILPAINEVLEPVRDWGANSHTFDAFIGTDNFDFLLEGIPTLIANQDVTDYLPNYHASSDTFDKVDLRELKIQEALAAVTLYRIANRPQRLGPRQSRVEVESLLRDYQLDQQMKQFGMWQDWESGARGRKQ